MFTGIIEITAKVEKSSLKNSSLFLKIRKPPGWKLKSGQSISTDGICLTVKAVEKKSYLTELMPETLNRVYFRKKMPQTVNLERSLRLGGSLDGHFVTGHVDAVGRITAVQKKANSRIYRIKFPSKYNRLVAPKGSIAVDGVSLTVVDAGRDWLSVALVDYTLKHTTLGDKSKSDLVNLEFDIIAKYLARYGARSAKSRV